MTKKNEKDIYVNIDDSRLQTLKEQLSFYFEHTESNISSTKDLNVVSLFSGCGGMDLGFEGNFLAYKNSIPPENYNRFVAERVDEKYVRLKPTRFKTVFANDILKDAKNTWVHNFSNYKYIPEIFYTESIVTLVKLHENGVKIFPDKVDIVTGGFPCQDFSVAGKRNGFKSHMNHDGKIIKNNIEHEETRGELYKWMKKVIDITKPNIFIAENVKGLTNLSDVKKIIQNDFSTADKNGYIVLDPLVLNAAAYGVPQSRERVIFIGIKKAALCKKALIELSKAKISKEYSPYPPIAYKKGEYITLKEIFGNLEEPTSSEDLSQANYSKAKFMGTHCQGQSEIKLNSIGPTIRAEHHGNIEFRRLSKEHNGKYIDELNHGYSERRLTVRECGLIQSFPPDFQFVIKSSEPKKTYLVCPSNAYKVVGNAVPPLLAYNLATRIEDLWEKYFKES
jgi:DNA (cytosine-5)-methyltransferase 1